MRARLAVVAALVGLALGLASRPAHAQCVDEELKQELVGGRHYRGVQERLFTKAFRHELSAMGGAYASDLYSSSWLAGGAYTFHFSEDLGLEASVQFTRFRSAVTDSYERRYPEIQVLDNPNKQGTLYFGHLIWSFAYGKLRWLGDGISRFDFNLAFGGGVTDDRPRAAPRPARASGPSSTSASGSPCGSTCAITCCGRCSWETSTWSTTCS